MRQSVDNDWSDRYLARQEMRVPSSIDCLRENLRRDRISSGDPNARCQSSHTTNDFAKSRGLMEGVTEQA
jgi:hypothetical protein